MEAQELINIGTAASAELEAITQANHYVGIELSAREAATLSMHLQAAINSDLAAPHAKALFVAIVDQIKTVIAPPGSATEKMIRLSGTPADQTYEPI